MTAKAGILSSLSGAQKTLFINVCEMFPTIEETDLFELCKRCEWNRDRVNSSLAENPNFVSSSQWNQVDRTFKKKKLKEEGKPNASDTKKKKQFQRRPRGRKFDRNKQGRGKGKDRKGKDSKQKRGTNFNSAATSKHLIQRTNAVTNTSAGSWAQKAKSKPPVPTRAPQIQSSQNSSSQHEQSSKSEKENSITNSNPELMAAPPGISMANSVWTDIQPEEPEQEVEPAKRPEAYNDFFDNSEQFNDNVRHSEDGTMYSEPRANNPASSYTGSHSSQMYPSSKYQEQINMKPDATPPSFQSDHDLRSSTSQYSRPVENIERERAGTGLEFRIAGDEPEFSVPTTDTRGTYGGTQEFKFGDVSNIPLSQAQRAPNASDSHSRPVSEISSAVGTMPPYSHNMHGQNGVTMPPANVMFPHSMDSKPGEPSEFLQLPPEMEEHRGSAIYTFGVDFTEERKMQSNDHQAMPEHLPAHVRGDPTQAAPRPARADFHQPTPYQRTEVNVDRTRGVNANVSRNNHDLNIPNRQVDNRFTPRMENSDQNQHNNFTEIGILNDVHQVAPHMPQRMDQFEERKSNQLEIDETRNQNRISNMHMPTRSHNRPDNSRGVPAEVRNPDTAFLNEAKHKEPATQHVYAETQSSQQQPPSQQEHVYQANPTQQYMTAHQPTRAHPNSAFKPKSNPPVGNFAGSGKDANYEQPSQAYGVDPMQQHNLEAEPTYSPTPPEPQYGHHAPTMVNPSTEYKQQSHYQPNPGYMTNPVHFATTTPAAYYRVQTYPHYPASSHWPPHATIQANTYTATRPAVGHPTYPTQVVQPTTPLYAAQFPYAPVR